MKLLSIGDRVRSGSYRLHSCFQRAVNYQHRGRLVSVVDESIGPGPVNIMFRSPELAAGGKHGPGLIPGAPQAIGTLQVASNTVLFAGHPYRFTARHRYHSALELPVVDARRLRRNLATLARLLCESAPAHSLAFLLDRRRLRFFRTGFERAFAQRIERAAQQVFHGDLLKGVAELKGCGMGLTPSGDDFIAGMLIGLSFLQKLHGCQLSLLADAICRAGRGDSVLSNTQMDLAREGLLFGHVKDALEALAAGNAPCLRCATQKLFSVGATSGADLATGVFMMLVPAKPGGRLRRLNVLPLQAVRRLRILDAFSPPAGFADRS